jgi:hypothetical protein
MSNSVFNVNQKLRSYFVTFYRCFFNLLYQCCEAINLAFVSNILINIVT